MRKSQEEHLADMREYYAERTDTPEPPVEPGDAVLCDGLIGIHTADYPIEGEVKRVTPRGIGTHNVMADWFVRVYFPETACNVYQGTTSVFFIGGSEGTWEESKLSLPE